jgi:hypothetical protein
MVRYEPASEAAKMSDVFALAFLEEPISRGFYKLRNIG